MNILVLIDIHDNTHIYKLSSLQFQGLKSFPDFSNEQLKLISVYTEFSYNYLKKNNIDYWYETLVN